MDAENPELVGPVSRERISFLNVPVDIVSPDQLPALINEFLLSGEVKNIALISLWDLLRARRNNEYRAYITEASLVIPIAKSLVGGVRFLTGKKIFRYMPFDFIITVLSVWGAADEFSPEVLPYNFGRNRELSLYILGGKQKVLEKAESNVRQTFPYLRIIGRHTGHFKKYIEGAILEAIRKASPSLLLVGKGVRGDELWIHRNSAKLGPGLRLWCSNMLDVFANKKKHPSRSSFEYGLEWIGFCFQNPLLIFRIFPYLYYKLLLVIYKLFKKDKKERNE
jgi:N-acetylglucosaminyldiphosphoundecaprenol N-acetyl-beta-D-mannosaminyltransferase